MFQITQSLMAQRAIRGSQAGGIWRFWVETGQPTQRPEDAAADKAHGASEGLSAARTFEATARRIMSEHYGVPLAPYQLSAVSKTFDLVSQGASIVGDAKFFTMVGGDRLPPAKFSVIAEHVWLLEKIRAPHTFLVFGNDRRVPAAWLQRYSALLAGTVFYFIDQGGDLETLTNTARAPERAPELHAENRDLEKAFHDHMLNVYHAALRECGYRATRFLQKVSQRGGLATAKDLLHKPGLSDGLTTLWQHGRLDLSAEALVLRDPWRCLFSQEELAIAEKRLRELDYSTD